MGGCRGPCPLCLAWSNDNNEGAARFEDTDRRQSFELFPSPFTALDRLAPGSTESAASKRAPPPQPAPSQPASQSFLGHSTRGLACIDVAKQGASRRATTSPRPALSGRSKHGRIHYACVHQCSATVAICAVSLVPNLTSRTISHYGGDPARYVHGTPFPAGACQGMKLSQFT